MNFHHINHPWWKLYWLHMHNFPYLLSFADNTLQLNWNNFSCPSGALPWFSICKFKPKIVYSNWYKTKLKKIKPFAIWFITQSICKAANMPQLWNNLLELLPRDLATSYKYSHYTLIIKIEHSLLCLKAEPLSHGTNGTTKDSQV